MTEYIIQEGIKSEAQAKQIAQQASASGLADVSVVKEGDKYIVAQFHSGSSVSDFYNPSAETVTQYNRGSETGAPTPPAPKTITSFQGNVSQAKDVLMKRYASGQYDPNYSASIEQINNREVRINFSRTPEGRQSSIQYPEDSQSKNNILSGRWDDATAGLVNIYEVKIKGQEQEADVRKWANERKIKVERKPWSGEGQGETTLRLISPGAKGMTDISIPIRSEETIKEQRAGILGQIIGQRVYNQATPIEKAGLHIRTILSPESVAYVGATVLNSPLGAVASGGAVGKNILNKLFSSKTTPTDVVIARIGQDIKEDKLGQNRGEIKLPVIPSIQIKGALESFESVPVRIMTMAAGGMALGAFGATTTGKSILANPIIETALLYQGGSYAIESGKKIITAQKAGKGESALGELITMGGELTGGATGFRRGAKITGTVTATDFAPRTETIKITKSEIAGVEFIKSGQGADKSLSFFKLESGHLEGLVGGASTLSGKTGSISRVVIPEQTLKNIQIPEQAKTYYSRSATKGKTTMSETGLAWGTQGKDTPGVPLAKIQSVLMREIGETTKNTKNGNEIIVKQYSGISAGKKAGAYDLHIIGEENRKGMVEIARGITERSANKIDWLTIEAGAGNIKTPKIEISGTRAGTSAGAGTASRTGTKTTPTVIIPKIEIGTRQAQYKQTKQKTGQPLILRRINTLDTSLINISQSAQTQRQNSTQRKATAHAMLSTQATGQRNRNKSATTQIEIQTVKNIQINVNIPTSPGKNRPKGSSGISPMPIITIPDIGKPPPKGGGGLIPFITFGGGGKARRSKLGIMRNMIPKLKNVI